MRAEPRAASASRYHAGDIREGDAYLDNDPYGGNTHPADHTFLVPVFIDGEHLFTTVASSAITRTSRTSSGTPGKTSAPSS
jgi:N-methylhydantoinase B/oxoprolinase/acetone carboxylase alpha subunit